MRVAYVSPSSLPSRTANAVHVALQCDGLRRAGATVTLYAKRTVPDAGRLPDALSEAYGIDAHAMRLVTYFSLGTRAESLRIAALALAGNLRPGRTDVILSRNLYASYALAVLQRRRVLFETHHLELGLRASLQKAIMTRPWVATITISKRLVENLVRHHGAAPARAVVLHDAAPDGIEVVALSSRRERLRVLVPTAASKWDAVCGYFGHLYPGRGIEIIEHMARLRPKCLFLVYGGNELDIAQRRATGPPPNMRYEGYIPSKRARELMGLVDVLLMPYQARVSIGIAKHDTADWMSPMKMFEYLASGVPMISSDLPALCEVLKDGRNSVLVPPASPEAWVAALDRLVSAPDMAQAIGARAHAEYRERHTWTRRALRLLETAQNL